MSLGSSTPKYLHQLGLINDDNYKSEDYETDINFLMNQVITQEIKQFIYVCKDMVSSFDMWV